MKKFIVYFYLFCCVFFNACSQQNDIKQGKIYDHVSIKSDTNLSYSIYIPSTQKSNLVFIFFDPHGSGFLPLTLYKNLAEEFGITLIGNNNSANGTDFNLIASNFSKLLDDIKTSYKIDDKSIALWGFSGGAKAAMYNAGFNNKISYCVYGGSVINSLEGIELLGFNGKQDMNYTELLNFAYQQKSNKKHFQIEFQGKHAWPDTTTAKDAFRWFLLKKMQKKEIITDKKLVLTSYNYYKKNMDALIASKQYLDALSTCNKSIHFLNSLTDISYFNTKKTFLFSQALFKTQAENIQKNFEKETKIKTQYQNDFFAKDTLFWKKEIADLWLKSSSDKSGIYIRLLGFLSLASYSYANRAFQLNDLKSLEQILFIYHYSDPTNPEQAFMRAKLYALKNETDLAKEALQESIKLGVEKSRIENEILFKNLK